MAVALEQQERTGIARPLSGFDVIYTDHYRRHKSDSPEGSKASLLRRALGLGPSLEPTDTIVDIGSGRQVFVMRFLQALKARGFAIPSLVSIDKAYIAAHALPGRTSPHVTHIRADGEKLPVRNNSAAAITSNMGLECMGEQALAETYRVLKPGGSLVANIFDRSMLRDEPVIGKPIEGLSVKPTPEFAMNMRSSPLLTDPAEIITKFARNGLEITRIEEVTSKGYSWVEVDAVKSVSLKLAAERNALIEDREATQSEGPYNLNLPAVESGARHQTEYDWVLNQRKKEIRITEIEAQLTDCPATKSRLLEFKKNLSRIQKKDRKIRSQMTPVKEVSQWVI